jgi:hypothetical protein
MHFLPTYSRRLVAHSGLLNTALYQFHKFAGKLSNGKIRLYKYYLIAQPVRPEPWLPGRFGANIEVRHIDRNDPVVARFPRTKAVIEERFNQGAECLVAFKDNQFLGYLWLVLGPFQEDEVRCRFAPQIPGSAAWDLDVYVEPEWRFGLCFLRLWDEANRFLRAKGIDWSISRISAFNLGSVASHARLGAVLLGEAVYFVAGSWQLTLTTLAPYAHFSSHPGSFPEIRLEVKGI